MKIYTKTGDSGETSLYDGTRLPKKSEIFDYLGDFDELNSHLGLLKAFYKQFNSNELYNPPGAGALFYKTEKCLDTGKYYEWFIINDIITEIQCIIMDICSVVAKGSTTDIPEYLITNLEKLIDRMESVLPKIVNFVVPSGNTLVSQIHVCRTISRRCERNFIKLVNELKNNDNNNFNNIRIYLNRLSDFLFVLSRFVAYSLEITEDLYSSKKGKFNKNN
jgi:cob(I)alamin adenosyltransferase